MQNKFNDPPNINKSKLEMLSSKAISNFLCLKNMHHPLPDEYNLLLEKMKKVFYSPGDVIIKEGDIGDSFYLIDTGSVAIISEKDNHKKIGVIVEGDFFGELALLTQKPRIATVVAETNTILYQLSKKDFDDITNQYPAINGTLMIKLYDRIKSAYGLLEIKNEQLEELNRIRTQLASIFTSVVLFIALYTFVLGFFNADFLSRQEFANSAKNYVSRVLEIITLGIVIKMIINSKLPIRNFGITITGWKRSILESMVITGIVITLLVVIKIFANKYYPGTFKETEIISFSYFGMSYITYLIIAPLQEFITRGTVQSTLERLFVGKNSGFRAILVTSFLFGSLHIYSSINFALAALITSWLWGWMYNRQQNLIGVSLSHFLIGNIAGLMGYWNFF